MPGEGEWEFGFGRLNRKFTKSSQRTPFPDFPAFVFPGLPFGFGRCGGRPSLNRGDAYVSRISSPAIV